MTDWWLNRRIGVPRIWHRWHRRVLTHRMCWRHWCYRRTERKQLVNILKQLWLLSNSYCWFWCQGGGTEFWTIVWGWLGGGAAQICLGACWCLGLSKIEYGLLVCWTGSLWTGASCGGASPSSAIKLKYSSSILAWLLEPSSPPIPGRFCLQSFAIWPAPPTKREGSYFEILEKLLMGN